MRASMRDKSRVTLLADAAQRGRAGGMCMYAAAVWMQRCRLKTALGSKKKCCFSNRERGRLMWRNRRRHRWCYYEPATALSFVIKQYVSP